MYERVDRLFEKLFEGDVEVIDYEAPDTRLAIALLLYRLMIADGKIRLAEVQYYRDVLEKELGVSEEELLGFEARIRELVSTRANTIEEITTTLAKLPEYHKRKIINFLEELSISDLELHETELSFLKHVRALLGLRKLSGR